MKNFTAKTAKSMVEELKANLEKHGQANSLPLFSSTPDKVLYSNVPCKVVEVTINGNAYKQAMIALNGKPEVGLAISGDAAIGDNVLLNVGDFVALRDYESRRGNKFEAGKTTRTFAYAA